MSVPAGPGRQTCSARIRILLNLLSLSLAYSTTGVYGEVSTNTLAEAPHHNDYDDLLARVSGNFGARSGLAAVIEEPEYHGAATLLVPLYIPEGAVPLSLARIARSGNPASLSDSPDPLHGPIPSASDSVLIRRIGPIGGKRPPLLPRRLGPRPPQRTRLSRLPPIHRSDLAGRRPVMPRSSPSQVVQIQTQFGQRLALASAPALGPRRRHDSIVAKRAKKNELSKNSQFPDHITTTGDTTTPTTLTTLKRLTTKLLRQPLLRTTTPPTTTTTITTTKSPTTVLTTTTTTTTTTPPPTTTTTTTTTPPPTTTTPLTTTKSTTTSTTPPTTTTPTTSTTTTTPSTTTTTITTATSDRRSVLFPRPVASVLKTGRGGQTTPISTTTTTTTTSTTTQATTGVNRPAPVRALPPWFTRSKPSLTTSTTETPSTTTTSTTTTTSRPFRLRNKTRLYSRLRTGATKRPVDHIESKSQDGPIQEVSTNQTAAKPETQPPTRSPPIDLTRRPPIGESKRILPVRKMPSVSQILKGSGDGLEAAGQAEEASTLETEASDSKTTVVVKEETGNEGEEEKNVNEKRELESRKENGEGKRTRMRFQIEEPSVENATPSTPRKFLRRRPAFPPLAGEREAQQGRGRMRTGEEGSERVRTGEGSVTTGEEKKVQTREEGKGGARGEEEGQGKVMGEEEGKEIVKTGEEGQGKVRGKGEGQVRMGPHRRRRPLRPRITLPPPITHARDYFRSPHDTIVTSTTTTRPGTTSSRFLTTSSRPPSSSTRPPTTSRSTATSSRPPVTSSKPVATSRSTTTSFKFAITTSRPATTYNIDTTWPPITTKRPGTSNIRLFTTTTRRATTTKPSTTTPRMTTRATKPTTTTTTTTAAAKTSTTATKPTTTTTSRPITSTTKPTTKAITSTTSSPTSSTTSTTAISTTTTAAVSSITTTTPPVTTTTLASTSLSSGSMAGRGRSPEQVVIESLTEIMRAATNTSRSKDKVYNIAANLEALNKRLAEQGIHIIHAEVDGVRIKLDNRTLTRPRPRPRPRPFPHLPPTTYRPATTPDSHTALRNKVSTSMKSSFSFQTSSTPAVVEAVRTNEVQTTTSEAGLATTKPFPLAKAGVRPPLVSSHPPTLEPAYSPAANITQFGLSTIPIHTTTSRSRPEQEGVQGGEILATTTIPATVTTRTRSTTVPVTAHKSRPAPPSPSSHDSDTTGGPKTVSEVEKGESASQPGSTTIHPTAHNRPIALSPVLQADGPAFPDSAATVEIVDILDPAQPTPASYTAVYVSSVMVIILVAGLAVFMAKKFLRKTQKALPESEEQGEGTSPITHHAGQSSHSATLESEGSSSVEAKNPKFTPWEFPRSKLRLVSILGEGNFGLVWKAEARDLCACDGGAGSSSGGGGGPTVLVAVKGVKDGAGTKERGDLLRELGIMQHLGQHINVVTLLGCCTQQEPHYVIMEYVMFGKLLSFLRDHRSRHNYYNFSPDTAALTSRDLTRFACQVANGCEYLQARGIIHRDLAARNILVDHNKVCKIADFGLARSVKDLGTDIYEQKSRGALPIRWMAPESLYMSIFTHKSDVWSFGILCWEIVTLGSTPYPGMTAREVMRSVREGTRLDRPDHCRPELYRTLARCWHPDLNLRPAFTQLRQELAELIDRSPVIDLENFPEDHYYSMLQNGEEKL